MNRSGDFKKFLLLWSGELVSSVGGGLTSFGLGVYVFEQTGSAAAMALVTFLAFLPTLLFSVPAGVLADRYDRRLLMMMGDGFSAIGIIFILGCMMYGEVLLWQICAGVTVSSIFSSLLEPSYRATVTDILTADEYSKASGLVSLAGSARYLVSPLLAGLLLAIADIRLLLVIDICTFFLTVITTGIVRNGLEVRQKESREAFFKSLQEGFRAVTEKRGVIILILIASVMTCFVGFLQTLAAPLILDFTDSTTLGIGETVCAAGMLVSSLYLGMRGIKKGYVKVLSVSIFLAGIGMVLFGLKENIVFICIAGFFFFAMLPFANNALDYLVRTNISPKLQGRAWGLIGFLSQLGYVVAYSLSGVLADGIGRTYSIGVGRGAAVVIMQAGVLLSVTSLLIYPIKSVRALETGNVKEYYEPENYN